MKILFNCALALCLLFASGVQAQTKIDRDSFTVSYPQGWTIDTEDEDYDPDALFSFDSPDGGNMIMFMIFTMQLDIEMMLDEQVKEFSKTLIKNPEKTTFTKWGNYTGKGILLKGKLGGVLKGFVRIFVYGDENKTMLVVEQCYDKEYQTLKKDYDFFESNFKFK